MQENKRKVKRNNTVINWIIFINWIIENKLDKDTQVIFLPSGRVKTKELCEKMYKKWLKEYKRGKK